MTDRDPVKVLLEAAEWHEKTSYSQKQEGLSRALRITVEAMDEASDFATYDFGSNRATDRLEQALARAAEEVGK